MEKENRQQFNVKLPAGMIIALNNKKNEVLQKTAKRIKYQKIAFQAFLLWLTMDGLGLKEAFEKARIEKAKVIVESQIEGKSFEITLTGEGMAEAFRCLRDAFQEQGEEALARILRK